MSIMTFSNSPFPLTQLTEFEVGETSDVDAIIKDDVYCELGDIFIEVHDLNENPIGKSCVDVVVAGVLIFLTIYSTTHLVLQRP